MKMAGQQNRGNRHGNTNDNNRGKMDDRKRNSMGKPERNDNRNDKGNDSKQAMMKENDKKPEKRDQDSFKDHGAEQGKDEPSQKSKFTGRCRLFVGNLPNDTSEDEFRKLFEPFGELSEVYVNVQRAFGFVRLDTRQNAENAKAQLDGLQKKGRSLRVRFATHGAALRVKHLSPYVSNELLESAFSQFGAVERAVVIVDDRGKPTGEGIVEFARKPGAQQALNRINDGVFLLGTNPRPIIVEPLEQKDEEDGLPEKFILKNQQFHKEHEQPPRFAQHGTFECEFAQKWKELYRMEAEQKRQMSRQMEEAFQKLDMEMESAHIEHQAMLLRQDYLRKQEELKRMEEEMQQRLAMRRQEEDVRKQEEERRRQELMIRQQQEEEIRRRQMERQQTRGGNPDLDLFGVGQQRQSRDMPRDMPRGNDMRGDMRDDMRGNLRGNRGDMGRERNAPPMQPPPAPPAGLGLERPPRQQGGIGGQGMNNQGGGMGGNMAAQNLRQSRFDQPPNNMGGGSGGPGFGNNQNMGGGNMGGMGNNMGGGNMMGSQNNMGNNHMQGNNMGGGRNMGGERNMGGDRMMDRRREAQGPRGGDDFYENKRPRRF